jgi:hypothetical protein
MDNMEAGWNYNLVVEVVFLSPSSAAMFEISLNNQLIFKIVSFVGSDVPQ